MQRPDEHRILCVYMGNYLRVITIITIIIAVSSVISTIKLCTAILQIFFKLSNYFIDLHLNKLTIIAQLIVYIQCESIFYSKFSK